MALLLMAGACHPAAKRRAPAIGEAYVGPAVLKIRVDIPLDSPIAGTAKHGERLEIIQRRRRFFRVRTPSGAEGWTDENQLLSAQDMDALRDLSRRAATLPTQGQAVTYGLLNVHTLPAVRSPSFLQLKEKDRMDVLAQMVVPRTDVKRAPLIPPPPKKVKVESKKASAKPPKYPPPPMPKAPAPPQDWLELSKTDLSAEDADAEQEPPPETKPIPTDRWSLVRVPGGQSGWVLTRRLSMAIPDEVAQYAEGHRIVSYFSLGKVQDGDVQKDIWLWTTASGAEPYDFDSFRVFIWSLKRHRYETAYIERNIQGYSPVLLENVDLSTPAPARGQTATTKYPGFSICMEKSDGQRHRREYALLGNIVRYAGERPCEATPPVFDVATLNPQQPAQAAPAAAPPPQPSVGLVEKLKQKVHTLLHRK